MGHDQEVSGFVPYEQHATQRLKESKDKHKLTFIKKRVGTHMRTKGKWGGTEQQHDGGHEESQGQEGLVPMPRPLPNKCLCCKQTNNNKQDTTFPMYPVVRFV